MGVKWAWANPLVCDAIALAGAVVVRAIWTLFGIQSHGRRGLDETSKAAPGECPVFQWFDNKIVYSFPDLKE